MRCCIVIAVVCLTTLGCGKPSGSGSGVSSEQENQMISRMQEAQQLKGKADTGAIENAVRNFAQAEGRFPSTLEDLVAKQLLEKIPDPPPGMKFVYQPEDGKVTLVSDGSAPAKPKLPSFTDMASALDVSAQTKAAADLKKIKVALNVYQMQQEGRFPSSLDELVKAGILDKLPALPAGKTFSYDSKTGTVQVMSK